MFSYTALQTLTFILVLIATHTNACRCRRQPPFPAAVQRARNGPTPFYFARVLTKTTNGTRGMRVYHLLVITGCRKRRMQMIATPDCRGPRRLCCVVKLRPRTTYALRLRRDGKPTYVTRCDWIANVFGDVDGCPKRCKPNQCQTHQQCRSGVCVPRSNNCSPRCRAGYRCTKGECVPTKPVCRVNQCKYPYICLQGRCTCTRRCPSGYLHKQCRCVHPRSCGRTICRPNYRCVNRQCVCDPNLRCMPGYRKYRCRCISNRFCLGISCPSRYPCHLGRCSRRQSCTHVSCGAGFFCHAGRCVRRQCSSRCYQGICYYRSMQYSACPFGSYCYGGSCKRYFR